jgi:hypothetical protein
MLAARFMLVHSVQQYASVVRQLAALGIQPLHKTGFSCLAGLHFCLATFQNTNNTEEKNAN